jgi:hypothetical protein
LGVETGALLSLVEFAALLRKLDVTYLSTRAVSVVTTGVLCDEHADAIRAFQQCENRCKISAM